MLDFRKVLIALSVAGLGLVSTASAQAPAYSCVIPANNLVYVASEGTTEILGSMQITCTASTSTATPTGIVSFTITTSSPLANQLNAGSTTKYDVQVSDAPAFGAGASPDAAAVTEVGPSTLVVTFTSISAAAQATVVAPASNTVTIAINNIRVNASMAPVSSTISAGLTGSGVSVTPGASENLGFVAKSIGSVVVDGPVAAPAPAAYLVPPIANTSTCTLVKNTAFPVSDILISEGFPDSLKSAGEVASAGGTAATQGTIIAVTLTNLNVGVSYYVPATITPSAGGGLALVAVTGPGVPATALATPIVAAVGGPPAAAGGSILVTSTSPTVYYEVSVAGGLTASYANILIPVSAYVPSVSALTSFASAPVGASVVLSGATAPAYPGYSGGITYTSTVTPLLASYGLLTPCETTLLFPYVTNASGFDTGIAITNASTLPATANIASISASSGTCALTFYGTGAATSPTPVVVSYGTVTTGTIGTPIAMGGSSTAAAGLTGYAVAVCNFVGAHGYAFISDQLGTGTGVAANYLAVVLNSGSDFYAPTPAVGLPIVPAQ